MPSGFTPRPHSPQDFDTAPAREAAASRRGYSRREFLQQASVIAGASAFAPGISPLWAAEESGKDKPRPRVAAVFTELRFRSHAYNFLENFLEPYVFNGRKVVPPVDVVSFYADQFPENDTGRAVAKRYGIPLYPSIAEALCQGGKELAVDAVLLIGEHGDYPYNELGQHLYPRKEFFDQIAKVVEQSGRGIPLFNDKHFSYRWDWAKEMYDRAKELGMPLLAGSSVPLAQRIPPLELPPEAKITEAVAIHGGGVEVYDFHGLEILQSLVEGRAGGETGVSRVQLVQGDALWKAADEGRWSPELAQAALAAELGDKAMSLREFGALHAILIDYRDGLKGAVLKVGSGSTRWNFACRLADSPKPLATRFYVGPWGNRNLFMALSYAIQQLFVSRKPPYPPERTLLTTGILDAAMHSRHANGEALATSQLEFSYAPTDFRAVREMGKTWELITKETPETKDILPGGSAKLVNAP